MNGYKIRDQSKPHFLTFTVIEWIDIFTKQRYRDILINNLDYCIKYKGLIVLGFVVMSNHVHIIMQSDKGQLSDLLRDFKKATAKHILEAIKTEPESRRECLLERFHKATKSHSRNKNYQFWKYGNHPKEIYSQDFLWTKLNYIHLNPVRAGIVKKASDYIYSSASNYVEGTGLIDVTIVDNPVIDVLKTNSFWKSIAW